MVRRQVFFFGRVQGVGFRYTVCSISSHFDVRGFVRNRPDGSVELVIEGESKELERFLQSIRDRLEGFIEREEATESSANGEFDRFRIR